MSRTLARKSKRPSSPKLSRLKRPEGMSLETWQRELRRQFGREQNFELENVGKHPFFSRFRVSNPASKNAYLVSIRGAEPGENHCTCPDFATNTLGTCKHIEFALARLEKKRGAKQVFLDGYQPAHSEVYLQYGAQREIRLRLGSDCPREFARLAGRYFDDDRRLLPEAFATFDVFIASAGKTGHQVECFEDALEFIAEARDRERREQVLDKAFPAGLRSAEFKRLLKVPLYEYQRAGSLFAAKAGRCLIGDEMGLGKTIQAIAAAEIMARNLGVERVLIVCPTSLKHQWEREIEKFTNRSARVISGLRHQRIDLFQSEAFFKIINYDTVYRDLELINQWSPDLVILDEAQRIKNWETRAAKSVKKIASPYAIVLTGTPLENRLQELVSIVQFIDMHRLGPTFRFLHEHQRTDEFGKVVGYKGLDHIGRTLEPILIRRRKSQVLSQLPHRIDKNFFVPMTGPQIDYHEENRETVAKIVQKWRRTGFLTEKEQRLLMIALQNMRMSCDSTFLLDHKSDHGVKADELMTLLEENLEDNDAKVVVFSQWVRMHELVIRRLEERGWQYSFLHGGVPADDRKGLIDRFRDDAECRLFLSTDAGGVGLNLQHASAVVNLDLPWNPAILEQRIGRVHRLGQTRPVRVTNFVSQGTIEEGMLGVLSFKKSLFAGVLDGGETEVFLGGSRLKQFMETVDKTTTSLRAPTPVETNGDGEAATSDKDNDPIAESDEPTPAEDPASSTSSADPLAKLIESGLSFLQQVSVSSPERRTADSSAEPTAPVRVIRDESTGQTHLQIPMPSPEVLNGFLSSLSNLIDSLRR